MKGKKTYGAPEGAKAAASPAEEAHASEQHHGKHKHDMATFKLLCQGRDGRLCLFEDADGHFTAVRSDRLA